METNTETVAFKSKDYFFWKEKEGIKPNTVRRQSFGISRDYGDEARFKRLQDFMNGKTKDLRIIIKNADTGESFERKVRDVSKYDGLYIISWVHPTN